MKRSQKSELWFSCGDCSDTWTD